MSFASIRHSFCKAPRIVRMLVVLLGIGVGFGVLSAQFFGEQGVLPQQDPGAFTANVSPYAGDRISEAMRHIEAAVGIAPGEGSLSEGSYRQAWEALKPLFDIKDFHQTLAPGGEPMRWDNLHTALIKLVKSLPSEGVDSYRRTFRGRSLGEYEYALSTNSPDDFINVIQRFPFTEGSEKAARVLGRRAWERGDFAQAAWAFEKLWSQHRVTPVPGDTAGDIVSLAHAYARLGWTTRLSALQVELGPFGDKLVTIGNQAMTLRVAISEASKQASDELLTPTSDEDAALSTLARSGLALAAAPRQYAKEEWKAQLPVPTGPLYNQAFAQLYEVEAPPMLPVVHGTSVLVNAGSELACYDLHSGSMSWSTAAHSPANDSYHLVETDPNLVLTVSAHGTTAFVALENPLAYSVVDPTPQLMGLRPFMPMVKRTLTAIDTVSGRMLWMLGGQYALKSNQVALPDLEKQAALTSFHHSVMVGGVLYAIGAERENQAEVFLFAIDPSTGRPQWRLSLCQGQVENTMFGAAAREPYPGIPVAAGGRLYVVSNLGGTICVDLAGKSVAWVVRYDSMPRPYTRERRNFYRKRTFLNSPSVLARDANGRELLVTAPTDARHIIALEADTGRVAWTLEIESRQNSPREDSDLGPSVLIGVEGTTVHVGHRDRHIRIDLTTGNLRSQREVMTRGDGNVGVALRLTGRPALVDGMILWPGSDPTPTGSAVYRVATIPTTETKPGIVVSVPWPREPGNLLVRRGVLLSQHGRDYVAGLKGSRQYIPTLSAHFDLAAMVADVRSGLASRPNDPEALIDFAMLAGQMVRSGQIKTEEVEQVLRRALELSAGHPKARRIADTARRGLFDQSLARAAAALAKNDTPSLLASLLEAEKYAISESQHRDIFLFRESGLVASPDALLAMYAEVITKGSAFLLSQGEHRLPAFSACRFRRAERLERTGRHAEAMSDWQHLLAWSLTDRRGEALRRDLIVRIHERIRAHGRTIYESVDVEARASLARLADGRSPTADELRGLIRLYPNSQAAIDASLALIKLRESTKTMILIADDFDREFELRGADPATAQVWVELLAAYRRSSMDVSAFVALGRAARLPPETPVTVGNVQIPLGDWVAQRRTEIREKRSQNLHSIKLPVMSDALWHAEFDPETRLNLPEQPLGFPDLVFAHGMMNDRALLALDAQTGVEKWQGPEVTGNVQLFKYDGKLLAMDIFSIRALVPSNGETLWTYHSGGSRLWTDLAGGLAISLTQESVEAPKHFKYELIAVNCQQGTEAWRTEVDPTNQQFISLGDHSIYVITNLGSVRQLLRVDLASGSIEAKVDLQLPPSSYYPLSMTPLGQLALVLQNGDIEVLDSVTLTKRSSMQGKVRSVRHVWPDSGTVIVIGNSGDCAAYNVDSGTTVWETPMTPGNFVMNAEVRSGRIVLIMLEQMAQDRPFTTVVLDAKTGTLIRREVLCLAVETKDGLSYNASLHHERAVFSGGMAILLTRQTTYRDPDGVHRQRYAAPMIAIVNFADGSLTKIETWEPETPQMWPLALRTHDTGLVFLMTDKLALHMSLPSESKPQPGR